MYIPFKITKLAIPFAMIFTMAFSHSDSKIQLTDYFPNQWNTDHIVPEGAYNYKYYSERSNIPQGYSAGAFWFQAATLDDIKGTKPAKIHIDYMKVIEKDLQTGKEKILEFEQYNDPKKTSLNNYEGGLYKRFPQWFCCNDYHEPIDASKIVNGILVLAVSKHYDRIYHWWPKRFKILPNKNYILELKYKIEGNTSMSIGFDFWRNMNSYWNGLNVNNTQAFVSDWYGDTNGKYKIIREPLLR